MSGGGFLSQSGSQGGSPSKKTNTNSSIRPTTIYQVLRAEQDHPDAEWMIDGQPIGNVTFVAVVRNITKAASNHVLLVEDGTAQIDCRKWADANGVDEEEVFNEMKNKYVRVLGTIKSFSGKMHVQCANIRVIEDMNEVLFHVVEAVHTSLAITRGPAPTPGGGVAPARNPYTMTENSVAVAAAYSDLQPLQRQIMKAITELSVEQAEGVNISAIARAIQSTDDKVRVQCNILTDEGHLYTTIDDDHVLSTA